ncbi:XrtA/PEP-CTERM system amidotransferase [Pacificimonas flava]|uniref:asparagine synthase (glutamine-hydrolyzing) n=1 Tax=Pacificimonas flava TaxID=1234595 RepID=M2U3Y6_9SPHN|nr:XrtA/PEP-CTERM system amidotransferase [Pacificimonas flava]EMD82683.1 Asparagine synthetase [Pacificimonas flava]MBB5281508.1 asparagine synthase (glutamine-hydrolyzing) [Pacificimonas flava]
MCGLTGIFDRRGRREVPPQVLDAMTDALAHRGPDGRGTMNEPGIALGHRRLSIIDVTRAGQPMASACGRYEIVFNGEIYNFREVRAELEAAGHSFRLDSDTEVLIEGYRAWGPAMLARMTGMFAVAIWDREERSLFLARDRFGVKPLYIADLPDGRVLFGSELKALLPWPDLPRRIDPRAVEDYFAYGYVPDDKCILAGIRQLPPAHYVLLSEGAEVKPVRYWNLTYGRGNDRSPGALAKELDERLEAAVGSRLVADVEVAAFLSGGVDSSAVVAMMARRAGSDFKTLSIGFDSRGYDETEYARAVAARYGTDHHERRVTADDYELIGTLGRAFDEPFADASAIPTYRVCELAREHVKVALSGDGADEAMAGYRRYRLFMNEERARALLPSAARRALFGMLGAAWPKMDWAPRYLRAKSTFQALGMDSAEAYYHAVSVTGDDVRARLFSPDMKRSLAGYRAADLYTDTFRAAPAESTLGAAQYTDIRWYLPGDIMTKVDRMSMANSLEAREPLLDHDLVAWMAQLPPGMRLKDGSGKWLLKEAVRPLLPQNILDRPKMGFVVPIEKWFRGALSGRAAGLSKGSRVAATGWFDMDRFQRMAADHKRGASDHSRLLWQMVMLEESLVHLSAG